MKAREEQGVTLLTPTDLTTSLMFNSLKIFFQIFESLVANFIVCSQHLRLFKMSKGVIYEFFCLRRIFFFKPISMQKIMTLKMDKTQTKMSTTKVECSIFNSYNKKNS